MNKAFEKISLIQGLIAAAFITGEGKLAGWCANSAIAPDTLAFIGENLRVVLSASRGEHRAAELGTVGFGLKTLVFRENASGLFLAYLDSPTNEAVVAWLFAQVDPLLAEAAQETG